VESSTAGNQLARNEDKYMPHKGSYGGRMPTKAMKAAAKKAHAKGRKK